MWITSKIIGLDLDGVIIDHTKMKQAAARQFGFEITEQETNSDLMRNLIPSATWGKIQNIVYDHLKAPLVQGVKESLEKIKQCAIPLFLISRRKNPTRAIVFLKQHALWPRYFNEKNTFFVKQPEDKNTIAEHCRVTHYIDDELSVLKKLTNVPNKFLFDQFGAFKSQIDYPMISSWPEILSQLIPISKEND